MLSYAKKTKVCTAQPIKQVKEIKSLQTKKKDVEFNKPQF